MATLDSGDILRVVAEILWSDGNINQNVFNCILSGAGSPWDDTDIADDCEDWLDDMYGELTGEISDESDGNSLTIYKYDSGDDDWDEVFSQAWTWDPSSVGEQMPRGVAALARLWTVDADVQGKKYIGGTTEGKVTDGLYTGVMLTAMLAFAEKWWAPFVGATSGATFTPGIWSVAQTAFKAAVEHYAVTAIPAYQRRRKRTVGI